MSQGEIKVDKFFEACSVVMSRDMPHIWPTARDALKDLVLWANLLLQQDDLSETGMGGFILSVFTDEPGEIEFQLSRQIMSCTTFEDDIPLLFDWTDKSEVASGFGVDLEIKWPDNVRPLFKDK